ncbi:MAG: GNAT family N-acetyltransferase [Bacteroidetes bacterium]|nr:GNAT family N-acetyltransferase [Bacteroidota bacterium]
MSSKSEQSLIDRPSLEALSGDLSRALLLRRTHKAGREIYLFRGPQCPALLTEVGRLREMSFRDAGGGTGKELDLDAYDLGPQAYEQLIVWDPEDAEIVAGYRLRMGAEALESDAGTTSLSTSTLFAFSEEFLHDYLPHTLELGRSFVQPNYQPGRGGKASIFSLDNLWDGLGALFVTRPQLRYLFGKVTMFTHFDPKARDILLSFLRHFFPDRDKLVWPKDEIYQQLSGLSDGSTAWETDYKEAYQLLNRLLRSLGENIPPLINSYMNLSSSMRTFGTAINEAFGSVEETGIMVTISDIYPEKKQRHMDTFVAK